MNEQPYSPEELSSDNRMLAAAAHFFGLWAALIIWATQKDRSRFVRFQSVQAMGFDGVMMLLSSVVMGCLMLVMVLGTGGAVVAAESGNMEDPMLFVQLPSLLWLAWMCVIFGYSGVLWVIRLIASVKTLQGQDFRYPWLGAQVEKFLQS